MYLESNYTLQVNIPNADDALISKTPFLLHAILTHFQIQKGIYQHNYLHSAWESWLLGNKFRETHFLEKNLSYLIFWDLLQGNRVWKQYQDEYFYRNVDAILLDQDQPVVLSFSNGEEKALDFRADIPRILQSINTASKAFLRNTAKLEFSPKKNITAIRHTLWYMTYITMNSEIQALPKENRFWFYSLSQNDTL